MLTCGAVVCGPGSVRGKLAVRLGHLGQAGCPGETPSHHRAKLATSALEVLAFFAGQRVVRQLIDQPSVSDIPLCR